MNLAAVAAAIGSALLFGLTSALQHRAASRATRHPPLHPGLLGQLVTDRVWLLGGACDVGAIVLQAWALHGAPVSLVQPILVLGLPCAALLSDLLARRTPSWREGVTCVVCGLSVAGLAVVAEPHGGAVAVPTGRWLPVVAATTAVAVLLQLVRVGHQPAVRHAVAAGISLGLASVLLRMVLVNLGHVPVVSLLAPGAFLLAVGGLGLLASQTAFQHGSLAGPLAALTVTEPIVAALGGVGILHEQLRLGSHLPVLVVAVVTGVGSVLLLSRTQATSSGSVPEARSVSEARERG